MSTVQQEENKMLQQHWDSYYTDNGSGYGSGLGSLVASTPDYRHLVENFLRLNQPRRVLDVGCGDWQSTKLVPWQAYDIVYVGVDVSPLIIQANTTKFASEATTFQTVAKPADIETLGQFDLIICKDVLQHTPNAVVSAYLEIFRRISKASLVTNDIFPSDRLNSDIDAGGWRPIDIRRPPFVQRSIVLLEYANFFRGHCWIKHVHLIVGDAIPQSK